MDGQHGRVLLRGATPVRINESDANGGGNRGGVRRSLDHEYQTVDGTENVGGATSRHQVDVAGITVDGDWVVHQGLVQERAGGLVGRGSGSLTTMLDEGGSMKRAR